MRDKTVYYVIHCVLYKGVFHDMFIGFSKLRSLYVLKPLDDASGMGRDCPQFCVFFYPEFNRSVFNIFHPVPSLGCALSEELTLMIRCWL